MSNSPMSAGFEPRPARRIAVRFDPTDSHPTIDCLEALEERGHGNDHHVHVDLVAEVREN